MFELLKLSPLGLTTFGKKADFSAAGISSVVFVCNMNLCRSPFAEEAFRKYLRYMGAENTVEAKSAGILVPDDIQMPETVRHMAHDFDLDLSNHQARQLTKELITGSDLVAAMDREILSDINRINGKRVKHARLLSSFSSNSRVRKDIADPNGRSVDAMRSTFLLIESCLEGLVNRILIHR